jgi:transcriptional regulator with XRE-family HTH domain
VDHTELSDRRRTYFRAVCHSAGLATMAALAEKLGVTHSTLTNIQNARRSAGPELIKKIERLAPKIEGGSILGAQALTREADVNLEGSHSIADRLKEAYRERLQELQSSEEMTSKNVGEVVKNFDSMGSDDVFIFASAIQQPFEMNPNDTTVKPAILNAIRRKSFFIYLRPTKEHLKRLGYFVDVEMEFQNFKATLFWGLSDEENAAYADRLVLIQAENVPLFVVPDFKWEIFYSDSIDFPHKALAGALVTAGTEPSGSGALVRVPLSADSTKRVLFEAVKAISHVNSGRRGHGKIPNKVISRLVESAERATQQKIKGGQ